MAIASKTQWQRVKLGSLGEFKNGVNFGKEKMGQGIRLINVKDVFSSGRAINFDSLDRIDLAGQKNIGNFFEVVSKLTKGQETRHPSNA